MQAANGDLLAFCERRGGVHDHAHNDIVLRRSSDGGETWGELEVIHDAGIDVLVDPAPVALPDRRIVLLYQRFPDGYPACRINCGIVASPSGRCCSAPVWIKLYSPTRYGSRPVSIDARLGEQIGWGE